MPSSEHGLSNSPLDISVVLGSEPLDALSTYETIKQTIDSLETEQVERRLAMAINQLDLAQCQLERRQADLPVLLKMYRKSEHVAGRKDAIASTLLHILAPFKCNSRSNKNALTTDECRSAYESCLADVVDLGACQHRLKSELVNLHREVAVLRQNREAEQQLVDVIFDHHGFLVDTFETYLRNRIMSALPIIATVIEYRNKYDAAESRVQNAVEQLHQSAEYLQDALNVVQSDFLEPTGLISRVWCSKPFKTAVDVLKVEVANRGAELAREAGNNTLHAKALCTDMPSINAASVQEVVEKVRNFEDGFLRIVFDEPQVDIDELGRQIQDVLRSVQHLKEEVQDAVRWLQCELSNKIAPDLAVLQQDLTEQYDALQLHRRQLLDEACVLRRSGLPLPQPEASGVGALLGWPSDHPGAQGTTGCYPGLAAFGYQPCHSGPQTSPPLPVVFSTPSFTPEGTVVGLAMNTESGGEGMAVGIPVYL